MEFHVIQKIYHGELQNWQKHIIELVTFIAQHIVWSLVALSCKALPLKTVCPVKYITYMNIYTASVLKWKLKIIKQQIQTLAFMTTNISTEYDLLNKKPVKLTTWDDEMSEAILASMRACSCTTSWFFRQEENYETGLLLANPDEKVSGRVLKWKKQLWLIYKQQ